jgi:hypothetical protein
MSRLTACRTGISILRSSPGIWKDYVRNLERLAPIRRLRSELQTTLANRQWRRADADILVIRHPQHHTLNNGLLRWLEQNFPEIRSRIDLRLMPTFNLPIGVESKQFKLSPYRLAMQWLQDPIPAWSQSVHRRAITFAGKLKAAGVPCINSPAVLLNAEKAATGRLAQVPGIRTPRTAYLSAPGDLEAFQQLINGPVVVRSDWSHGETLCRVESQDRLPWHIIRSMLHPIAVEFIDTSDSNGIFWKYRYLAAGTYGVSVHMIGSTHWEVRGKNKLTSSAELAPERGFISRPNADHQRLQAVRAALALDTVALDYALDRKGSLVIWEANPCPGLWFGPPSDRLTYRDEAIHRSYAALTGAYLDQAGIPVPESIQSLRSYASCSRSYLAAMRRDV